MTCSARLSWGGTIPNFKKADKISATDIGHIGRRKPFSVPDTFSTTQGNYGNGKNAGRFVEDCPSARCHAELPFLRRRERLRIGVGHNGPE